MPSGSFPADIAQAPVLALAPTIFDTFAGADSSVLAAKNWANTFTGGATAVPTVQGQRARFVAGATGGYVAADNVIVAANVANFADGEIFFKWEMGSANSVEHYLWVGLRATQSAGTTQDGYFALISCGFGAVSMDLYKRVAGASTNLGSLRATYSPSVGEKALFRLRVQGSTISGKIWAPEAPEPSSWTRQVTDTSVTAAGAAYLHESGASAAVAGTNYLHRAEVRIL